MNHKLDLLCVKRELEIQAVGAGLGGGFEHTDELKVMNYKQAMKSADAHLWVQEIKKEYERFEKFGVFTPVSKKDVPKDAKVMTTTWAMKKKTNGKLRGRLNARGCEQVEGAHYMPDSIAAPVTNPTTVRLIFVLLCMNPQWVARIIDVEGAFLQGKLKNGEVIYTEVPDGMEEFYGSRADTVLLLNVPIYGTKQAANCFYDTLVKKLKEACYKQSSEDPCLFFFWLNGRLVVEQANRSSRYYSCG
jgi:hypothetical protein